MLQVYNIDAYYKLDDGEWLPCGKQGAALLKDDTPGELVFLDNASWAKVQEVHNEFSLHGFSFDATLFRKREYLEIRNWASLTEPVRLYKSAFPRVSYKHVYTVWADCSISWLLDHAPAEEMVQYLKERGLSVCPVGYK